MPECAACGATLTVQDEGALFHCPDCDEEIGVEQRDRIVEDTDGEALVADQDITLAEAEAQMWRPKTDAAVREIPFDWSARVELSIERFCDRYDGWPVSRSALHRRVMSALQATDELTEETTHCHGLRASAATHMAGRGISTLTLQAVMGWSQASTARVYVRAAPDKSQRELLQTTGR